MPTLRAALSLAALSAVCALVAACPGRPPGGGVAVPTSGSRGLEVAGSNFGLGFRLGDADGEGVVRLPPAAAAPLSDAAAARVLARLPPVKEDAPRTDWAIRGKSAPPPRAGTTAAQVFPPPAAAASAPSVATGELRVLRRAPEGDVALAPYLSITFSHPMVALSSVDDLARVPVPVDLAPKPVGTWRWVGSQTAQFQPESRFPMATEYRVVVPAGTRAITGHVLARDEGWSFSTPPPKVVRSFPLTPTPARLDPLIFVEVDQEIAPGDVLAALSVTANGSAVAVRGASVAEMEADADVRRLARAAAPGRALAFAPVRALPPDAEVKVSLGAGTPSREGPRRTTAAQSFTFRTRGAMKLVHSTCGWGGGCAPLTPFQLSFSNPIDEQAFDAKLVTFDPPIPALKITAAGSTLVAEGRTKADTAYKITVAKALRDTFGEPMSEDARATVRTGPARPQLFGEEGVTSVLEPGAHTYSVFSLNHAALKVTVLAVGPEQWSAYLAWREAWDRTRWGERALETPPAPPGRVVMSAVVRPKGAADTIVETPLELAPALKDGLGHAVVVVEPTAPPPRGAYRQSVRTWVQATRMGLDAVVDHERATVWATELATGAPLGGVDVGIGKAAGRSGPDGLAVVDAEPSRVIVARRGGDVALLPAEPMAHARGMATGDELRWFVFDDRRTYKPGEELHAKGWLRTIEGRKGGDVVLPRLGPSPVVRWVARDARGGELAKGDSEIDASFGFDLAFKVPDQANLGGAHLELIAEGTSLAGARGRHAFQIQEFRRPEFEVTASSGPGPHFAGGHAVATVAATYYAGGGLPAAPAEWRVTRDVAHFTPPNRSDWHFGEARPFWPWPRRSDRRRGVRAGSETWSGTTNHAGEHRLRIDFDAGATPFATNLALAATVTDVNRQAWTARSELLVHPGNVYVGLRADKQFVGAGEALVVRVLATDLDGKPAAGRRVTLRSARIEVTRVGREEAERELDVATCDVTSGVEPSVCRLATREGGVHRVTARVTDEAGRASESELELWVQGGEVPREVSLTPDRAQITANKESYQPGETAELLVASPFVPAEGVMAVVRSGVVRVERFTVREKATVVRVPIDDTMVPNLAVAVRLVGSVAKEDAEGKPTSARRPAFATARAQFGVKATARTLQVEVTARERELEPGGATSVAVVVRDAAGAPVPGARVTLAAVDEAVLALSGAKTPDPIGVFYMYRPQGAFELATRPSVISGRLRESGDGMPEGRETSAAGAPRPASPASSRADRPSTSAEGQALLRVRKDLGPLALWAPGLVTDARGLAEATLKVPDSLTRYRVYAVAVAREREFGAGEGTVTARLPLVARPSAPRFLNLGDQFELPIVVQNQTQTPMTVDVVARATNARLTAGAGRRVDVPAHDRVEVRLPAAAVATGTARFQVAVAGAHASDAAEVSLPVWAPATSEAFATYGELDQGAVAQPVKVPAGVLPAFGGLEITTSSTALQTLTDAVLYLTRYPYECSEQIASRVLAVSALKDVLAAFRADGLPPPDALTASVTSDLARLRGMQTSSGGWAFWRADQRPAPFVSVHVAHALARARARGFAVPDDTAKRASAFLRNVERHFEPEYSPDARRTIASYALYVRRLLGDADPAKARQLVAEAGGPEKLSLEALGWILPVLTRDAASAVEVAAIRRHLANRVTEAAGAAHFATTYGDEGAEVLLHSDRRADAVLLEALIDDQPKSTVIPKLVAGLLGHRTAGRWSSTQENAFALLALERYFRTYEREPPDFIARIWLGDRAAGEQTYKGRGTERKHVDVPMRALAELPPHPAVVLAKEGPGRLYYRIGMQYAPSDLAPPPIERGFSVERTYEPVGPKDEVRRDDAGTWHVKSGASVRVRLRLATVARRYHVALLDPLPAGLEPLNPSIALTGDVPRDPKAAQGSRPWWWGSAWYEHQNMRDERVEAFASLLYDGVYEYSYVARATTPGTFIVPPPRVEEMYAPETFGRGAGARLVVE